MISSWAESCVGHQTPHPLAADLLVLVFSRGVSLREWRDSGLLEREWALYQRLAASFGRMVLFTHGGVEDHAIARELRPPPTVVCNETGLSREEFERRAGELVRDHLASTIGRTAAVIVKTNQFSAGRAAIGIADALRTAGRTVALVARGGYPWGDNRERTLGPEAPEAKLARREEAALCHRADFIVGTTQRMIDDLRRHDPQIERRAEVIPNYVLTDGPAGMFAERSNSEILFAGRLELEKRVDLLVRAVAALPEPGRSTVTLSIIGEGDQRSMLEGLTRDLDVRADFASRMPHRELLARMRRCAVYAQLSAFEGHPKTVLEAMATGCCVLVADAPGLGDVIEHGVTGITIGAEGGPQRIAEALASLLNDAKLRARLGEAAAAHARTCFSLDRICSLELAACRRALAQSSGAKRAASTVPAAHCSMS